MKIQLHSIQLPPLDASSTSWQVRILCPVLVRGDAGYIAGNSTQSGDWELKEREWTSVSAPRLGPYHRAYKMLYNFRGIGTSWQVVKTLQPGSQDETTNKQLRRRFLLRRLLTIFCRYIALAILYEVSESGMLGWPTGSSLLDGSSSLVEYANCNQAVSPPKKSRVARTL